MRGFVFLAVIWISVIAQAQPARIKLSDRVNVRGESATPGSVEKSAVGNNKSAPLQILGQLPPGTEIEVDPNEYQNAEKREYIDSNGAKQISKNGFVRRFRVISIPGQDKDPKLRDLQWMLNEYRDDVYISKNYLNMLEGPGVKPNPSGGQSTGVSGGITPDSVAEVTGTEAQSVYGLPGYKPISPEAEYQEDLARQRSKEAADKLDRVRDPRKDCEITSDEAGFFESPEALSKVLNFETDDASGNQSKIPKIALKKALGYFAKNGNQFPNKDYITIIDYTQGRSQDRMFLIHKSGRVERFRVAHGKNTGDGRALDFSNQPESKKTPAGFFKTGENIGTCGSGRSPKKGCMWLDGLESRNDNSRRREVIFHGAWYVNDQRVGRSWGCPAVSNQQAEYINGKTRNGSLWYHFTAADL
jgi:hypothetical protein